MIALVVSEWKLVYIYNDEDDYERGFVVAFILSLDNTGFHHYFLTIMGNSVGIYITNIMHVKVTSQSRECFSSFNSFCGE